MEVHRLSELGPAADDPRFKSSVHLGNVPFTDIPLYLHYFSLLFFGFRILNAVDSMSGGGRGGMISQEAQAFFQVATMLSVVFTVLIHELGHAFCSKYMDCKVSGIMLLPFGGVTYHEPSGERHKTLCIALWGPLMHVFLIVLPVVWVLYSPSVGSPQTSYLLGQFMSLQMRLQIELFVLNLLVPAYPLDGSKVWAGVLLRHLSISSTAHVLIGWLVVSAMLIGLYAYYFSAVIAMVAILWIIMQIVKMFGKSEDQLKQVPPFQGLVGSEYVPVSGV